ncbi:hypothetical protein RFI_25558 [Reticulomyxa filosa]|uniref:Kelch motif family protein n=1 Tax=Reticulomyxa filosa TaxID=46433 RepID=X6MD53_RETFI|nr:hypothetical protein RFI_25558 [Reticulomyxa filosa]|eukprot:ETO11819.1 hypothetical protein RFI_25558 [Reticulomyxa filosa]
MFLFCRNTGLLIEYDKNINIFQFHQRSVCRSIAPLFKYAYVCVNDAILFFGGFHYPNASKAVHKYSIRENKWMAFENALPSPLYYCVAILNEENNHIHIIGGKDDKMTTVSTHMETKVYLWDPLQLSKHEIKIINQYWIRILDLKLGWIDDFNKFIFKYCR